MGSLLFAFGSAVGAAFAWFVVRREPGRSAVFALNGIACGLLGVLMSAGTATTVPAIEAGIALLGTAAPLTLCMTPLPAVISRARISSVVRRFAATLALALVYGISCATLGFVSVESVRHISGRENESKPVGYPIMVSLKRSHTPSAVFPGRL